MRFGFKRQKWLTKEIKSSAKRCSAKRPLSRIPPPRIIFRRITSTIHKFTKESRLHLRHRSKGFWLVEIPRIKMANIKGWKKLSSLLEVHPSLHFVYLSQSPPYPIQLRIQSGYSLDLFRSFISSHIRQIPCLHNAQHTLRSRVC